MGILDIISLIRYHEKFTRDCAKFLAYILAPRLLNWTWSREKYTGIEGHTSKFVILFLRSLLLARWVLRESIFLSVLGFRPRGGTLLVIIIEFGQYFRTSSIRQLYWCVTLSAAWDSKSLPHYYLNLMPDLKLALISVDLKIQYQTSQLIPVYIENAGPDLKQNIANSL